MDIRTRRALILQWPKLIKKELYKIKFAGDWYYKLINRSPSHHATKKPTIQFVDVRSIKITTVVPIRLSKEEFGLKWLNKLERLGELNK